MAPFSRFRKRFSHNYLLPSILLLLIHFSNVQHICWAQQDAEMDFATVPQNMKTTIVTTTTTTTTNLTDSKDATIVRDEISAPHIIIINRTTLVNGESGGIAGADAVNARMAVFENRMNTVNGQNGVVEGIIPTGRMVVTSMQSTGSSTMTGTGNGGVMEGQSGGGSGMVTAGGSGMVTGGGPQIVIINRTELVSTVTSRTERATDILPVKTGTIDGDDLSGVAQTVIINTTTIVKNSFEKRICPDFICYPPEESDNCTVVDDPTKLNTDEFAFMPEDECCTVYKCMSGADGYIGLFGGHKNGTETKRRPTTTHKPVVMQSGDLCAGVVCKAKPTKGSCSPRNATTMSSTAAYGPKSICCPVWACTMVDGSTTLHFGMSGPGVVIPKSLHSKKTTVSEKVQNSESCKGIVCLGGQPSLGCRKNTPSKTKSLMKIQYDCCPMWTCTFPINGSIYVVHPGMRQRLSYWKLTDDDTAALTIDPPPVIESDTNIDNKSVNGTNSSAIIINIADLEIDMDSSWGVKMINLEKTSSASCPRVECVPPQVDLKCSLVKDPVDKNLMKLMGLEMNCCPVYKCAGYNKTFLLQFGMSWAEPISNNTNNESSSPTPLTSTTVSPDVIITTPASSIKTITTPAPSIKIITTAAPSTPVKTKTTAAPSIPEDATPTNKSPTKKPAPKAKATTETPDAEEEAPTAKPKPPKKKPAPKKSKPKARTEAPADEDLSPLTTTESPTIDLPVVIDEDENPEEEEDLIIVNSTVNKPQCKSMQCFPPSSEKKCVQSAIADCEVQTLLGSAADCCPAYKCASDDGDTLEFGITDGISETVLSNKLSEDAESEACDTEVEFPLTTTPTSDLEVGDTNPDETGIRPVVIFQVIYAPAKSSKEVRYVKTCKGVNCLPPAGINLKVCQKLPKETVPRQMKALGVKAACCPVWKCIKSGNSTSTHYGVSRDPATYVPFEYKGNSKNSLPTSIVVKDREPVQSSSKCNDVICVPPLKDAQCKVAPPSAFKTVEGSLRGKKKCCPIWTCRTKEGTFITLYGRTSPKTYAKTGVTSILKAGPSKITSPRPPVSLKRKRVTKKPKVLPTINKVTLVETDTPDTDDEEEETTTANYETTVVDEVDSKNAGDPATKPQQTMQMYGQQQGSMQIQQQRSMGQNPMQMLLEQQMQMQKMQGDQMSAMQQANFENMKMMQSHQGGMNTGGMNMGGMNMGGMNMGGMNMGGPFPMQNNMQFGPPGNVNSGGGDKMHQKIEMNGMVMQNSMPNFGPPLPHQSMQLPGMSMTQFG